MATYWQTSLLDGNAASKAAVGNAAGILKVQHSAPIADDVGTVLEVKGTLQMASATNFVVSDVVELAILPADHVPVSFVLTGDTFDSNATPTFAVQIGMMTGAVGDSSRLTGTVGVEGGTAIGFGRVAAGVSTVTPGFTNSQTVGASQVFTAGWFIHSWPRITPSFTVDRSVGLTVTTAPATSPATTRRLDFQFFYRIASYGQ